MPLGRGVDHAKSGFLLGVPPAGCAARIGCLEWSRAAQERRLPAVGGYLRLRADDRPQRLDRDFRTGVSGTYRASVHSHLLRSSGASRSLQRLTAL